jgi:hypothetical protein
MHMETDDIDRNRILIKIASTWERLRAAEHAKERAFTAP